MFSYDGMSDHASWSDVFHYWDSKLSCKDIQQNERERCDFGGMTSKLSFYIQQQHSVFLFFFLFILDFHLYDNAGKVRKP